MRVPPSPRTVILEAVDRPLWVVFEMRGQALVLPAGDEFRLVLRGPESAGLRIVYGEGGISVYRDGELDVEVLDGSGRPVDVGGF
jgi:hypothetical protein